MDSFTADDVLVCTATSTSTTTTTTTTATTVCLQRVLDANYFNDRFTVDERPLGAGGSGKVYLIVEDRLAPAYSNRSVVKVCKQRGYVHFASLEVEAHAAVTGHPYIVPLLEALTCQPLHSAYIFTEYIEMGSLYHLIRYDNTFAARSGLTAIAQLLSAVSYCHSNGVLHLDVASTNVFVRADESICLGDFGASYVTKISPTTGLASAFKVQSEMTVMQSRAPEVLLSNLYLPKVPGLEASTATDIWGVGCVMAELFNAFRELQICRSATQHLSHILTLADVADVTQWPVGRPFVELHKQRLPTLKVGSSRLLALSLLRYNNNLHNGGLELLCNLLAFNPANRPSAEAALTSRWFSSMATDSCASVASLA